MSKENYKHKAKCNQCGATLFFCNCADAEVMCSRCKTINKIKIEAPHEKHTENRRE